MSFGDGCGAFGDGAICGAGTDACESFGGAAIVSCTNIIGESPFPNLMQLFEQR